MTLTFNTLRKTADMLDVLDPMRGAHPIFQRVFTTFFETETQDQNQREKSHWRINRRGQYPPGLGASNVQITYEAEFKAVNVVYHQTPIVRFMPDRVELNTGGWGTRTTALQIEQWLNFAGMPCRVFWRYQRGGTQSGTLFVAFGGRGQYLMKGTESTYIIRDGIQFSYDEQPLTDDQPFTGRLRHQGRMHSAGLGTTVVADALQLEDVQDWRTRVNQLEGAIKEFQTPPEYEGVEPEEEAPPTRPSQEAYPGMTPQEIREEHARRTRAHELWTLQHKHTQQEEKKLADALWSILQTYANTNGWSEYDSVDDIGYEYRVWGKKFADGLHWTAFEGVPSGDEDVNDYSNEPELVYDEGSSVMPWSEFFTDESIMEEMAENYPGGEYDEVDPELYFSYTLQEGRPEFNRHGDSASTAYRWILNDMDYDDRKERPFVAAEFYAPEHWPTPRPKPDPDQYSMFTYDTTPKPIAPGRPRTERTLRPHIYTSLTFEATPEVQTVKAYVLSDSAWVSPTGEIVTVASSHEETAEATAQAVYGSEFNGSSFSGYLFLMTKSWMRVSFGNVSFSTLTAATREWLKQYIDDRSMYNRGDVHIDRWHINYERYYVEDYQMLYDGPPVDAWDALTSVVSTLIPPASGLQTTADWETYLSGLQFDPQTFLQYARRNQLWSFSRPGQGPRQGQPVHRFVHISRVDPARGQVDGHFGYSMEQVMTSERPESAARPVDDQWTTIQYIAAYHPQDNENSTDRGGSSQEVGQ